MASEIYGFLLFTYAFLALAVYCSSWDPSRPLCTYLRTHELRATDCSGSNLEEVPKNLIKSNTEVLDLSSNMIYELTNQSFLCCTSIRLLYLQNNKIFQIQSHAFAPLTSLTVLDLSSNVLINLPANLPLTLEKLFLDHDHLMIQDKNNPVVPISKITSLNTLHFSENRLQKFPNFNGSVPSLIELNIKNNYFTEISVDDLAGLCQLKYLVVSPNTLFKPSTSRVRKEELCACLEFEKWIMVHQIEVTSFKECPKINDEQTKNFQCDLGLRNKTLDIFQDCLANVSAKKTPLTLITGSCAYVLLLGIIIWLYVRHRRRTREKSDSITNHQNRTPANFDHVDNIPMEENSRPALQRGANEKILNRFSEFELDFKDSIDH